MKESKIIWHPYPEEKPYEIKERKKNNVQI